ncbi:MAG TPA: hypothetical protein VL463_30055 [Kofleriaceae bacterium]|jgi:hypothetical protein|nr:hypothetical protein [Kofleriaceae bacterium]
MHRVPLTSGARAGWVYVRALRGDDEESIEATDTASAVAFVDRLLAAVPGAAAAPGDARRLTAADRDRVLAAIYLVEVSARVRSSPVCPSCGARFDLDFALAELVAELRPDHSSLRAEADGSFTAEDGTRFRIPNGDDELASVGEPSPSDALAARCHLGGPSSPAALAALMERAAPLIDVELDAVCPDCGHRHAIRFDIQSFLLGSLIAERKQRAAEVQALARSFGWSLTEILAMTRRQRRLHVELAERASAVR